MLNSLKLTNAMLLQCYFQSDINVSKISLFKYKIVLMLEERILKRNKINIVGEKILFLLLLYKNEALPLILIS